jgi:uncharacterized protein (DUF952 family)
LTGPRARRITPRMAYYKILRASEWEEFAAKGHTTGSPADVADGYIHLCTAEQVDETARRHFAGEHDLVILTLDKTRLDPTLKWEPARGGQLFPHLYRELGMEDVVFYQDLPLVDGRHIFLPPH